jgi:hypothetical protein
VTSERRADLNPTGAKVTVAPPVAEAEPRPRCPLADEKLGLATVNREDVAVLARPSGFPVEGWDGNPLKIDPRFDFQILKSEGEWSQVRILAPKWPGGRDERLGWIARPFVGRVDSADERQCLFVVFDAWSGVSPADRKRMREMAVKILREDGRCSRLGGGCYLGQGQRYFLSCYPTDGGRPYHYWFSATDSPATRSFADRPSLSRGAAISRCRAALDDAVSRRAKIAGRRPEEAQVESTNETSQDGVHYVTFTYTTDDREGRSETAYCLAPPGSEPEITLR